MKTVFTPTAQAQVAATVAVSKETTVARLGRNTIMLISASLIVTLPFLF